MPFPEESMVDEGMDPQTQATVNAEGSIDGARTLSDAAARLRQYAAHLEDLERQGWQLEQAVQGGSATIVRR